MVHRQVNEFLVAIHIHNSVQEGSYQFVDTLGGASKNQTLLYGTSHHCIVLGPARPVSSSIGHFEICFWDLALATNITLQKLLGEF
jgi:hypothetical protein